MVAQSAVATPLRKLLESLKFVYSLSVIKVRRDVKNYTLGVFWWYLDPIINTMILYFITVVIMARRSEDMIIFLLAGLLVFRYLQTAISASCSSLNPALALSSRLYVPKYAFVARDVAAESAKFLIGLVFLMALAFWLGKGQEFSLIETVVVTVVAITFAFSFSCLVALASALVRDVKVVIGYMFRALFFVSGTFFGVDQVPEHLRSMFLMNPFARLMHEFRLAVMMEEQINIGPLMTLMAISIVAGVLGLWLLLRYDRVLPKYAI